LGNSPVTDRVETVRSAVAAVTAPDRSVFEEISSTYPLHDSLCGLAGYAVHAALKLVLE